MKRYVAFLRGINVGGNKKIPMADLAALFEEIGFGNVTTIQAAGNVIFECPKTPLAKLTTKIETAIEAKFGFGATVQVIELEKIRKLIEANPFSKFTPSKETHWYVTFLNDSTSALPSVKNESFTLLAIKDSVLFSILYRNKGQSTDFMTFLDKTFGKQITTRNWNTLVKIAALGRQKK